MASGSDEAMNLTLHAGVEIAGLGIALAPALALNTDCLLPAVGQFSFGAVFQALECFVCLFVPKEVPRVVASLVLDGVHGLSLDEKDFSNQFFCYITGILLRTIFAKQYLSNLLEAGRSTQHCRPSDNMIKNERPFVFDHDVTRFLLPI